MIKSFIKLTTTLALLFLLCSCAPKWKNTYTNEIRDSIPKYPECKKEVPELRQDAPCYTDCTNYFYKKYGKNYFKKNRYTIGVKCSEQCQKPTGKTKITYDWHCNYDLAKRDGWVTQ